MPDTMFPARYPVQITTLPAQGSVPGGVYVLCNDHTMWGLLLGGKVQASWLPMPGIPQGGV